MVEYCPTICPLKMFVWVAVVLYVWHHVLLRVSNTGSNMVASVVQKIVVLQLHLMMIYGWILSFLESDTFTSRLLLVRNVSGGWSPWEIPGETTQSTQVCITRVHSNVTDILVRYMKVMELHWQCQKVINHVTNLRRFMQSHTYNTEVKLNHYDH